MKNQDSTDAPPLPVAKRIRRPRHPKATSVVRNYEATEAIRKLTETSELAGPLLNPMDRRDFEFHCRALTRIAAALIDNLPTRQLSKHLAQLEKSAVELPGEPEKTEPVESNIGTVETVVEQFSAETNGNQK